LGSVSRALWSQDEHRLLFVRMVQAGNSFSFTLKPFTQFGSVGKVIRKDFDGDNAFQACVAGTSRNTPQIIKFEVFGLY
jgi:hypothetical protein